jgi:uncharacterized protein YndB with AHSA1/START domain
MPTESFRISTVIAATPAQIYEAWLDADLHSAMTGGEATIETGAGGRFTSWGDYISGTTLEVEPQRRIVQRWRTTQFPADAEDSRLEVLLSPEAGGTRLSLVHGGIPAGQGDAYRRGWEEFYFQPMKRYFARNAETERPPPESGELAPPVREPRPTIRSARPKRVRDAESGAAPAGAAPARAAKAKPTKKVAKRAAAPAKRSKPAAKKRAPTKRATAKRATTKRATAKRATAKRATAARAKPVKRTARAAATRKTRKRR